MLQGFQTRSFVRTPIRSISAGRISLSCSKASKQPAPGCVRAPFGWGLIHTGFSNTQGFANRSTIRSASAALAAAARKSVGPSSASSAEVSPAIPSRQRPARLLPHGRCGRFQPWTRNSAARRRLCWPRPRLPRRSDLDQPVHAATHAAPKTFNVPGCGIRQRSDGRRPRDSAAKTLRHLQDRPQGYPSPSQI